jgi:hypothetical protein
MSLNSAVKPVALSLMDNNTTQQLQIAAKTRSRDETKAVQEHTK